MTEETRLKEDVPQDKAFRMADGSYIRNIQELYSAINKADDSLFAHHVTESRNDFGNWVKDVHKDYRLANSIFRCGTKEECAKAVQERLYELERSMDSQKEKPSIALLPGPAKESSAPRRKPLPHGGMSLFESAMAAARLRDKGLKMRKKKDLDSETSVHPPEPELSRKDAAIDRRLENKIEDIQATEKLAMNILSARGSISSRDSITEAVEGSAGAGSVEIADPAEELVQFAQNVTFRKQFLGEISAVFKKGSLKDFSSEMKGLFAIQRPEERVGQKPKRSFGLPKMPSLPRMSVPSLPKMPSLNFRKKAAVPAAASKTLSFSSDMLREEDRTKKEMLDNLKKVYK